MEKSVRGGEAAIIFLCSIGAFFIKLPLSSDDGTDLAALLFAFLLSILSVFVIYRPLIHLLNVGKGRLQRAVLPIKILVIGGFLIFTVDTLAQLSAYTEKVVLQGRSRGLIFIFLAALFVTVAKVGQKALSKTAVALALIAAAALATVFVFFLPSANFKYLGMTEVAKLGEAFFDGVFIYFKTAFEGLVTAAAAAGSATKIKNAMLGTALASLAISAAFFITLLVFGGGFAETLRYPFTSAVGIVGRGEVFSGMDGFLYLIIFVTSVFKGAAALFGAAKVARGLKFAKNFK